MWEYADVHKYGVLAPQFSCFPRTTLEIVKKYIFDGYVTIFVRGNPCNSMEIIKCTCIYEDRNNQRKDRHCTLVDGCIQKFWCTWKSMDFHVHPHTQDLPCTSMYEGQSESSWTLLITLASFKCF